MQGGGCFAIQVVCETSDNTAEQLSPARELSGLEKYDQRIHMV